MKRKKMRTFLKGKRIEQRKRMQGSMRIKIDAPINKVIKILDHVENSN